MERENPHNSQNADELRRQAANLILEHNLTGSPARGVIERTDAMIQKQAKQSSEYPEPTKRSPEASDPILEAQVAFAAIAQANQLTEDERIQVLHYIRDNKIDIQAEGRNEVIQQAIEDTIPRCRRDIAA